METNKKSSRKEAASTADAAKKKPEKVLRIDDVSVSIFANEREVSGEQRVFHSCNFQRSYRDAAGTWKRTQWFDSDDLAKVAKLAMQADEFTRA
jgi:hypothetical protein